jgi:hypothetical protein
VTKCPIAMMHPEQQHPGRQYMKAANVLMHLNPFFISILRLLDNAPINAFQMNTCVMEEDRVKD